MVEFTTKHRSVQHMSHSTLTTVYTVHWIDRVWSSLHTTLKYIYIYIPVYLYKVRGRFTVCSSVVIGEITNL